MFDNVLLVGHASDVGEDEAEKFKGSVGIR